MSEATFAPFKLLISAIIATALLVLLLNVLGIIPLFPIYKDPLSESAQLIKRSLNEKPSLNISDPVVFAPNTTLTVRSILNAAEVPLREEQLCLSLGLFKNQTPDFSIDPLGTTVGYTGSASMQARLYVFCDTGYNLIKDVEMHYSQTGLTKQMLEHCSCISHPLYSRQDCCAIVLMPTGVSPVTPSEPVEPTVEPPSKPSEKLCSELPGYQCLPADIKFTSQHQCEFAEASCPPLTRCAKCRQWPKCEELSPYYKCGRLTPANQKRCEVIYVGQPYCTSGSMCMYCIPSDASSLQVNRTFKMCKEIIRDFGAYAGPKDFMLRISSKPNVLSVSHEFIGIKNIETDEVVTKPGLFSVSAKVTEQNGGRKLLITETYKGPQNVDPMTQPDKYAYCLSEVRLDVLNLEPGTYYLTVENQGIPNIPHLGLATDFPVTIPE